MRVRCVDKTRKESAGHAAPKRVDERFAMIEQFGDEAFLLPQGTPRLNAPSYPVVSKTSGCYHCGLMRAAYTRIGTQINRRSTPASYKKELIKAREQLIKLGLQFANKRDRRNSCNWAIKASKRYKVREDY